MAMAIPQTATGSTAGSAANDRFQFGENWLRYLAVVGEEHVREASQRLAELLGDISGKSFLDVGCGSGIHSLAAIRLGAARVHSFDRDPQSVQCALEMKRRFAPEAGHWSVESGSVLDADYLRSLGKFDIVYSWGVLHHTGDMWKALELVTIPAKETLAVCLYQDQGAVSRVWRMLKRTYVRHRLARPAITLLSLITLWGPKVVLMPHRVARDWRNWRQKRGMSPWHDIVDWAGGYPYEFCKNEDAQRCLAKCGFALTKAQPFGKIIRCTEFVFTAAHDVLSTTVENDK